MTKTKRQTQQEKRLQANIEYAKVQHADARSTPKSNKPPKKGGLLAFIKSLFVKKIPRTVQDSIPYQSMYRDGICRVTDTLYTKTVQFQDITYQLAQNEDKTQIFESYCDFLNYFDSTISVQLTFINQRVNMDDFQRNIDIPKRDDGFNWIRDEYADMLKGQLGKGNNGLVKKKYITFGIEADNLKTAKMRLERIETDVINNFKVLGVKSQALNGLERLEIMHGQFHPDGRDKFRFQWNMRPKTGLDSKNFIAPSSFEFSPDGKYFKIGQDLGAVSFVQILAPELTDRMLADFLDMDDAVTVNLHIQSINQMDAIKNIKRKMSDLQKMKIEEQVRPDRAYREAA